MDNANKVDVLKYQKNLNKMYQLGTDTVTGSYSPLEVEEAIQAGRQINREQMTVLNNYWQVAARPQAKNQSAQRAVVSLPLQTQENVGFFTKLKNKFFGRFAKKSAQGNPVQEQASQKFTVKKEEADQIRDRIAGSYNPYADHVSYEILRQEDVEHHEKENTVKAAKKAGMNVPAGGGEYRTFLNYVHGFGADKDGNPLTEKDKRLKEENLDWVRRYVSTDKTECFSALDQIVDEILNFNFTPAMLKDTYFDEHFRKMNIFGHQLLSLENLCKVSERNKEYFEHAIEPKKKELLDARSEQFGQLLSSMLGYRALRKGVQFEGAGRGYLTVPKDSMEEMIAAKRVDIQRFNPEESFNQLAKKEKMVAEFEKRMGKQETKIKKQLSKQSKETKENKTNVGIAASDAARVRTFVSDIDERIAENPQMAERYKTSVDKLYAQINKESNLRDEAGIQIAACAELQKEIADRKKAKKKVTPEEEEMGDLARRQENFLRVYRENQHVRNIAICGNAIRFFLTGEKLGDDALKLIKRLGLNDDLTGKNEELNFSGAGEGAGA